MSSRSWIFKQSFGDPFFAVRADVENNIERLSTRVGQDEQRYERLFNIVQDEVDKNAHADGKSCTTGLLWLKRSMEFMVLMLQSVREDESASMNQVVGAAYQKTLYQNHSYWTSTASWVAFKFVPARKDFLARLGDSPTVMDDMQRFTETFSPILAEIHTYMVENNLNDPYKV